MRRLLAALLGLVLFGLVVAANAADIDIDWQPPTENVDGTPLTDLAGFRVYVSTTSGSYTAPVADFADPLQTAATVSVPLILQEGDNNVYVVMTAYDDDGNESAYSNEVLRVVTVTDDVSPNAPVIITITISVGVDCPPGLTCAVSP